jgi:hypothetical protein
LILIGVKADKIKQNIPVDMPGATNLGADARARIMDTILSTVQPRPLIEDIGLAKGRTAGGLIAVIRVREGNYPPYQFQRGATIRIPVRLQDTNRQATVREIEALFEKRMSQSRSPDEVVGPYTTPDLFCTSDAPNGEHRETDYHKVVLVPRSKVRIRQDSKFERAFEKLILSAFPADLRFSRKTGRGNYFQVERREQGHERIHRIWRSWADGAVGFVGNLTRPFPRGYPIGDLAAELLFTFRLAKALWDTQNYFGGLVLSDEIACGGITFASEFPPPDGIGDYDVVSGVHLANQRPQAHSSRAVSLEEIERTVLENPEEIVAQVILDQLRETWGASINFEKLLESINRLSQQSSVSGWGRN